VLRFKLSYERKSAIHTALLAPIRDALVNYFYATDLD
jgi:hypothetical protein